MPTSQNATYPEGVEIKVARIRAGLRQYEVATSVGVRANRLSEIESGRRRPSAELLERIHRVIEGNSDAAKAKKIITDPNAPRGIRRNKGSRH